MTERSKTTGEQTAEYGKAIRRRTHCGIGVEQVKGGVKLS